MKITVVCDGGVIPACLDHVKYDYKSKPGRIRILEFVTDNVRMLETLYDDPDVMSFEVNKSEKWRSFFASEQERYAAIAASNEAHRKLYDQLDSKSL